MAGPQRGCYILTMGSMCLLSPVAPTVWASVARVALCPGAEAAIRNEEMEAGPPKYLNSGLCPIRKGLLKIIRTTLEVRQGLGVCFGYTIIGKPCRDRTGE